MDIPLLPMCLLQLRPTLTLSGLLWLGDWSECAGPLDTNSKQLYRHGARIDDLPGESFGSQSSKDGGSRFSARQNLLCGFFFTRGCGRSFTVEEASMPAKISMVN
jgi:hypothetical protein